MIKDEEYKGDTGVQEGKIEKLEEVSASEEENSQVDSIEEEKEKDEESEVDLERNNEENEVTNDEEIAGGAKTPEEAGNYVASDEERKPEG